MSYKTLISLIVLEATKYGWKDTGRDYRTGRLNLEDDLGIYKLQIYCSKMTVGVTQKGQSTKWLRDVTKAKMLEIFKEPLNVII